MDAFTTSAAYYEVLANRANRLNREGPFLLEYFRKAPSHRVVDIGCGVGLHALFLAEHGAEVTALDASPEMIEHARHVRPHPRIEYRRCDMRTLIDNPWGFAICLGNTLSLIGSESDLDQVFERLRAHLSPGGLFVAQILNYARPTMRRTRHRTERHVADGREIVAIKSLVPQHGHTLLTLNFFADQDGTIAAVSETAVLRNWSLEDLTAAAARAGLTVLDTFGSYHWQPFDPARSSDLILVMQRAA